MCRAGRGALRNRRCDRNGSEGNEQIFDLTGGKIRETADGRKSQAMVQR